MNRETGGEARAPGLSTSSSAEWKQVNLYRRLSSKQKTTRSRKSEFVTENELLQMKKLILPDRAMLDLKPEIVISRLAWEERPILPSFR